MLCSRLNFLSYKYAHQVYFAWFFYSDNTMDTLEPDMLNGSEIKGHSQPNSGIQNSEVPNETEEVITSVDQSTTVRK